MAMTPKWLFTLKLLTALGCGLAAGVFFAFSTFVMPALVRLQPPQGIAAMQSINITAINPLFMIALTNIARYYSRSPTAVARFFLAIRHKWLFNAVSDLVVVRGRQSQARSHCGSNSQCHFCESDSNTAHSALCENQNTESHRGQSAVLPKPETVSSAHPASTPDTPNGTPQIRQ
jgi:hypothetical protein